MMRIKVTQVSETNFLKRVLLREKKANLILIQGQESKE